MWLNVNVEYSVIFPFFVKINPRVDDGGGEYILYNKNRQTLRKKNVFWEPVNEAPTHLNTSRQNK